MNSIGINRFTGWIFGIWDEFTLCVVDRVDLLCTWLRVQTEMAGKVFVCQTK